MVCNDLTARERRSHTSFGRQKGFNSTIMWRLRLYYCGQGLKQPQNTHFIGKKKYSHDLHALSHPTKAWSALKFRLIIIRYNCMKKPLTLPTGTWIIPLTRWPFYDQQFMTKVMKKNMTIQLNAPKFPEIFRWRYNGLPSVMLFQIFELNVFRLTWPTFITWPIFVHLYVAAVFSKTSTLSLRWVKTKESKKKY